MTELSPAATVTFDSPLSTLPEWKGTSGPLLASTEGKIVDSQTGEDIDPTSEGEVVHIFDK